MKWFKFWTYVKLPIEGFVALLFAIALFLPGLGPEDVNSAWGLAFGAWATLCLLVAYGLHSKLLVAYDLNDVMVLIFGLLVTIPRGIDWEDPRIAVEFGARFTLNLLVVGLIWYWPNWVYWTKRKPLFRVSDWK